MYIIVKVIPNILFIVSIVAFWDKSSQIITKELFDFVQGQVKSQIIRSESKEFAFTKMMTCGLCGSGITADEKFKKQQNGNVHRYVYYGCTKIRDKECKCGYIEEKELIKQFAELLDKIDIDEIGIRENDCPIRQSCGSRGGKGQILPLRSQIYRARREASLID